MGVSIHVKVIYKVGTYDNAMHEMKTSSQQLQEAEQSRQSQQADVDNIDQQIASLMGEIQKLDATGNHHR